MTTPENAIDKHLISIWLLYSDAKKKKRIYWIYRYTFIAQDKQNKGDRNKNYMQVTENIAFPSWYQITAEVLRA